MVGDAQLSYAVVFFFQAEDGIRDLVRSRGLGDVYKRQRRDRDDLGDLVGVVDRRRRQRGRAVTVANHSQKLRVGHEPVGQAQHQSGVEAALHAVRVPVSYTHLTLPTSDLV